MIEMWKDEAGEWRFTVKGRNGEIIVTSEGYTRARDAMRGLNTLTKILSSGPSLIEALDGAFDGEAENGDS